MKHAFLILTHFAPEKINAQVELMQSPHHYFFIHFDQKQNLDTNSAAYIKLTSHSNVIIIAKRINVQWGSFRIVEATIALMREALNYTDISYMHLMSGECLNVKSITYIHDFFRKNNGKEYLHHFIMPEKRQAHSFTYQRVDKFHFHNYFNPRSANTKDKVIGTINSVARKAQRLLKLAGVYRRYDKRFPTLYAGVAWWSLTFNACKYIIEYVDQHPDFYQRFKYVQLPDEIIFQTIIMGSPFAANVVNDNVRFHDFTNSTSNANPLTMEHIKDLNKENILFGRKFTPQSAALIEYLQKNVF